MASHDAKNNNSIFGHDISKHVWSTDFDISYGDKEIVTCKLFLF